MKKNLLNAGLLIAATILAKDMAAQGDAGNNNPAPKTYFYDSLTRGGYTLTVDDQSPDFDTAVKRRLVEAYFNVYPKEAALYNPRTVKSVRFWIDPLYEGVAEAGGNTVRFNPNWFKKKPGDIDVVTHEVMHLVQNYPGWSGPGWITEGIADYVRHTMGIDNAGADWSLPDYKTDHSYENAYRITARFFVWIENKKKKGLVKKLDGLMRAGKYKPSFWKIETGKTVDELWKEYAANPAI